MDHSQKIMPTLGMLLLVVFIAVQATAATVQRSNFIVGNLSCTSCLETIAADLRTLPGTLGMDADLSSSRVTVDHLSTVDSGQIVARISKLGYPAALDWTATIPEQSARRFSLDANASSTCAVGGCGSTGVTGAGLSAWKDAPADGTVRRTTLQVNNLTCTSCLADIATELRKIPETYGMRGYLSRGIVIVDHADSLDNDTIAAAISSLGYPVRILALNEVPVHKAFCTNPGRKPAGSSIGSGLGCNSNGACNATAASWKKLYNRYFSTTNSK